MNDRIVFPKRGLANDLAELVQDFGCRVFMEYVQEALRLCRQDGWVEIIEDSFKRQDSLSVTIEMAVKEAIKKDRKKRNRRER